tara:strand:- start:276 stop:449 length:174 start_codon:yes stop_codon:yes gene_type:complete
MKDNKTFSFYVPCSMMYYIKAKNEKEARQILINQGGISIQGDLLIDKADYLEAEIYN